MHSIRIKITAITFVAILISVIGVGAIGIYTVDAESDQDSVEKMALVCDDAKRTLDSYLNSLKQSVEMAARVTDDALNDQDDSINATILMGVTTSEQKEEVDDYLTARRDTLQKTFESIASSTQGVVTYYYCVNPDVCTPEYGFFYSKVNSIDFEEQPPLDATELDPNDLEHYTWYFTPIERGEGCWTGPYRAHFLDEAITVSYVMPLYKDGVFLGVLGMDILFDTFIEQLNAFKVYKTGFISLMDSEGHILYHPELEFGSTPDVVSGSIDTEIFKQENSSEQLIRYMAHGEERQLSFTTLTNGMKLVVTAPVSEIESSQRHLTQIILLVAAIILVVFTVVTLLAMRAVTKPLLDLTAASQKLAAGDYDIELDYEGKDEVGALTESFRQMRDNLKQYIEDLNVQVATDALTGIKNKGAFDAAIGGLDEKVKQGGEGEELQFALIMFDCNRLKDINDEHGHARGDIYLRTASKAICHTFTHSPVFRVGGDEFAVLLQGGDYEARETLVKEFDQRTNDINAAANAPWERVDIAMGMAEYRPGVDKSAEEVLYRADELMYLDKRLSKLSRGEQQ